MKCLNMMDFHGISIYLIYFPMVLPMVLPMVWPLEIPRSASELSPVLQKIEDTPMTLHEAAKRGDVAAVQTYLEKKKPLDSQVTPGGDQSGSICIY